MEKRSEEVYTLDMQKLWFSAKRYGWGWTPCSWEGWVITAIAAFSIGMNIAGVANMPALSPAQVFSLSVLPTWVTIILLIIICYLTGEKPRWRWGGK